MSTANDSQEAPPSLSNIYGQEDQVAKLAAVLVSGVLREGFSTQACDMSHSRHDELFYGALKRAQWILEKSSNPDDGRHAYQVFREGEVYSAAQIADEFKSVGWNGLTINSVKPLMKKIEDNLQGLPNLPSAAPGKSISETHQAAVKIITDSFLELEKDKTVCAAFKGFGANSDKFIQGLDRRPIGKPGVSRMIDNKWHESFSEWCFSGSPASPKYRPHEIFRFAAMQELFPEQICRSAADLSQRFTPYPPKDLRFFTFECFEDNLVDPVMGA